MDLKRMPVVSRASRRWRAALMAATFTAALAAPAAHATTPAALEAATWVPTKTQAHDPRGALHVAALKAGVPVRVSVVLQVRDHEKLDALVADLAAGRTHRHLSSEEFLARHAPTEAQVAAVVSHLARQGFTDIEVAPNRLVVTATGNAASVQRAFHAEMHEFDVGGRRAYANVTPAEVPAALGGTVLAVTGLQTLHAAHVFAKRLDGQGQGLTAQGTAMQPQALSSIALPSLPTLYGASSLPAASNATVGIVTAGSMTQVVADLKAFASNAGYPVPNVSVISVGQPSTDTSGLEEWNMDSQASLAAAGGSLRQMLLYTAASLYDGDLTATFNRIVADNKAKAINVSLGECENDAKTSGSMAADDLIFRVAMSQGQTFSVSSGDSGAFECGTSVTTAYPASSPFVMAVGGTTLSHSGSTWTGETAWSCTNSTDCPQSASGGTGGGISGYESAPSWQVNSGVLGSTTRRGVPDIAFDANPSTGAIILVNGSGMVIGGTSLAAPIFAGFWARIQGAHGNTLPHPATSLYAGAASHATWFHDVTSGSNGHYSAGTGWDYVTGFGSLQVGNFSSSFGTLPVANFSVSTSRLNASFANLSGVSSGSITAYDWNFGDGTAHVRTANASHAYAKAGTYTVVLHISDSLGRSASKSMNVTVSSSVAPKQLIVNPGFESGADRPWSLSAGLLCTTAACAPEPAHSGTGFLWLGGYGTAHTDYAEQTVTIPGGVTSAMLSFYLKIESNDTGSTAHDIFRIQVVNVGGAVLKNLGNFSNVNRSSGYVVKGFDLKQFAGQAITIRFTAVEDASLTTSFLLDDVAVNVK